MKQFTCHVSYRHFPCILDQSLDSLQCWHVNFLAKTSKICSVGTFSVLHWVESYSKN